MCLAQRPQRIDAGEAGTCGPSVWSQALYHQATALPTVTLVHFENWYWVLFPMVKKYVFPLFQKENELIFLYNHPPFVAS